MSTAARASTGSSASVSGKSQHLPGTGQGNSSFLQVPFGEPHHHGDNQARGLPGPHLGEL